MPVAFKAFHWQPVRRTKKIASIALRSGTRGLWQPKGCFGRAGSRGSILAHSPSGKRQPASPTSACIRPLPAQPKATAGETAPQSLTG